MRVFYNPPPGSPPFAFEYSSQEFVFQPPDKYWKKVGEWIDGAAVMRKDGKGPAFDANGKPKTHKVFVWKWIPDDERNAALERGEVLRPQNYLDCSKGQLSVIFQGKNAEAAQWMKREDQFKSEHRDALAAMQSDFEQQVADLKRRQQAALRKLTAQVEQAESALQKPFTPPAPLTAQAENGRKAAK
jgi:hypothetical protein